MLRQRPFFFVFLALLYCLPGAFSGAQAYTSIVVIGDSLTDTGNDATVSNAKYGSSAQVPGPATGYTNGRFTDGTDTVPAAKNYYGVWIEQLAALLPNKPVINYSLNGGANYAYGFATTNTGTTNFTYGPGMALNFPVNNMGAQLSSYLATNPVITNKTLFVVWGGANDLISATSSTDIQNAAMREAGIVQALISAGATEFIVPNLPPLGLVPRFNGSAATSVPATTAAAGFDQYLAAYLAAIPAANPGKTLHIYQLDTYTLFNTIVAAPSSRGFTNVTASSSAALTGITTVNPDTYLFWDDLHPTTYGHNQLATTALTLMGSPLTTTSTLLPVNPNVNLNSAVTLQVQVGDLSASSTPMGTVTFLDGANTLFSTVVTGSTAQATASYTTTSLTAGTHTLTVQFTGANGFVSSTSNAIQVTVTAPALTASFSPSTLTVTSGSAGASTLTLTPVGGYSGTATLACGTLPAHFTCSTSPASLALANNVAVSATVSIGTSAMASLRPFSFPGSPQQETVLFACMFPGAGLLAFGFMRSRRRLHSLLRTGLLVALFGAAAAGLSGCSNSGGTNNNFAAKGTYTVPVTVTVGSTVTTQNLTVMVQ